MHPDSVREALIVEAIGEAARLIREVQTLAPALDESRQALLEAHSGLATQLSRFEAQVLALTERSKVLTVQHALTRTDEAARQAIDVQRRAMADAARVALGAELGAALQRHKSLRDRPGWRWDQWLTHAAAAALGAIGTLMLSLLLGAR